MSKYTVMKKKGMTSKQYISLLEKHLAELNDENNTLKQHVNDIIDKEKVVPKDMYDKILKRYFDAVHTLKNYNLWTSK
jgi:3-dehydroquinate synthetase